MVEIVGVQYYIYIHAYIYTVYIHTYMYACIQKHSVIVFFRSSNFWKENFSETEFGEVFDPHGVEHSKEMVALVLHHTGMEPVHPSVNGPTKLVHSAIFNLTISRDNTPNE